MNTKGTLVPYSFWYVHWGCSNLDIRPLPLYILMDYPMHIDRISIGLSIVYFKGSHVEFSRLWCISVHEDFLILVSNADLLGLGCLPKYQFWGFQYTKGLITLYLSTIDFYLDAAFHQGLHCWLRQKLSSKKENLMQFYLEIITCDQGRIH